MDSSGTSNLPDSQLDRFMISFSLSELNNQEKVSMLKNEIDLNSINSEKINWNEIKDKKNKINVSDEIYNYVLEIEQIIRSLDQQIYISPRCLKQIIDLGKGWAMINSKNYVTHQDIKDLLPYVLKHRIKFLKQEEKNDFVISEILNKINIKK
jgi:MoxR-like ATPase